MPGRLVNIDNDANVLVQVELALHIAELEALVVQRGHTEKELVDLQQAIAQLNQILRAKAS